MTIKAALQLYSSLVAPRKRVVTVPLQVMSAVDRIFMGGKLRAQLQLMGVLERLGERGDPSEANRVLGASTTTIVEWCTRRSRDG